jgi:hypothetical protein
MCTLGDAVVSMVFEWSNMPREKQARDYDEIQKARATAQAISEVLHCSEWQTIPLEDLFGLDAALVRHAEQEGFSKRNRARYARQCRRILDHAKKHGFSCDALGHLERWKPIMAAFNGEPRGLVRMLESVATCKEPADTTENDLEAARRRAVVNGLAESTSESYISKFRGKMRAANLESSFPLLELKMKRPATYCDLLAAMTAEARAQLDILSKFRTGTWVPGRDARDANRPAAVERMILSYRELHGFTRTRLHRKPVTLRDLVVPENVCPWVQFLHKERGLFRESIWVAAGPIHAIACKHPIFQGFDFGWMLALIRGVPKEARYKRQMRKQKKSLRYEVIAGILPALRAKSQEPGLSAVDVAWLRHDESLLSALLLALRQRNVRSSGIGVNLVAKPITLQMAFQLDLPECVRSAWNEDHRREFLMLVYGEEETKSNRAETVVLPLARAETFQEFVHVHRGQLINPETDHGRLFLNRNGGELSEEAFRRLVRCLTREHIGKAVSPHLWRSIFGARVMRLAAIGIGGGMRQAQRALFHAEERTTQPYLDLDYALPGILALNYEFIVRPSALNDLKTQRTGTH